MSRFLTLNVGASKATLAEYQTNGKRGLTLVAYGSGDLGEGGDSAGLLSATLPSVLHGIMREKGIKPAPVVLSLSGQAVFPRFAKFPPLAADKLEALVQGEIEQNVPFPIDEIVCDHQFTGETPEGDKAAMIVAAKLDQVRETTDAVRAAGLVPVIVDAAPTALCNALKYAEPGLSECCVLLDVGSKTTNLIIIENEKIYNRSIPVAGNAITKEIAQAFGCSLPEAEEFKRTRAYVSLGGVTEDADETTDRIAKIVRTVLTRLNAEISRSINFYRSQQGGNAPTRLYLTGGSCCLPQIDQFFTDSLQIPVEFLNPFAVVKCGPRVKKDELGVDAFSLAESCGLAVRMTDAAFLAVNLMPPELVERARNIRRIPFLAAGAVGFLAALALGVLIEQGARETAERQVTEVVSPATQRIAADKTKLENARREEKAALEAGDELQQLLSSRAAVLARVAAVRKALVPGMWITAWEPTGVNRGGSDDEKPVAEGAKITIRGWSDALSKVEQDYAKTSGGKRSTAAEIVQNALKGRPQFVAESVKIVAQKDVKGCLTEFTIAVEFAPLPSACGAKTGKKKGKR